MPFGLLFGSDQLSLQGLELAEQLGLVVIFFGLECQLVGLVFVVGFIELGSQSADFLFESVGSLLL